MTARCGAINPVHRSKGCHACDRIYKQRSKAGMPRFRDRMRANAAVCAMCGLMGGNSSDIPVLRYALRRWHNKTQAWIGSIGMCDRCLVDAADIKPAYYPRVGVKARDDGLRSSDGMPVEAVA